MDTGSPSASPSLAALSPAMVSLVRAVAAVRAQVPAELPGAVALPEARVLMGQLDVLKAVLLGRLADVDRRQLYALDDVSSTSAWVQAQATAVGAGEVALARRLASMPHLQEQVAAGELSLRAAQAVGVAVDRVRPFVDRPGGLIDGSPGEQVVAEVVVRGVLHVLCEGVGGLADDDSALQALIDELVGIATTPAGQLGRLERAFTLLAQRLPATLLGAGLDRLVDAVLPLQLEQRERDGHRDRAFTLQRKSDGSGFRIARGELSQECGEYLLAVLGALRITDPANPQDTAAFRALRDALAGSRPQLPDSVTRDALDEGAPGDPHVLPANGDADAGPARSGPVRRDGLLDDTDAAGLGPEPRSRVQQDHDALLLALRALLDSGLLGSRAKTAPHVLVTVSVEALEGVPGALPAVSQTSGASLPAALVRRLLCDSRLTRAVLGLGSRVLEVSHTERTARPHERLALLLRWGGRCAEAGCTSPPGTPVVPHHGTPWARSRVTALDDQVPLCPSSHHRLHDGRIITLRDRRRLGPDGWATETGGAAAPAA